HARQFFGSRLGFAEHAEGRVAIVIGAEDGSGVRVAEGAARSEADLSAAERAEARAGGGGLAGLARRCPTVWRVAMEGGDDRVARTMAVAMKGCAKKSTGTAAAPIATTRASSERAAE